MRIPMLFMLFSLLFLSAYVVADVCKNHELREVRLERRWEREQGCCNGVCPAPEITEEAPAAELTKTEMRRKRRKERAIQREQRAKEREDLRRKRMTPRRTRLQTRQERYMANKMNAIEEKLEQLTKFIDEHNNCAQKKDTQRVASLYKNMRKAAAKI